MAKRVVIGARWLGREQKFVDYFDGYLAGLSVNFGEQIDEKVRLFKRIVEITLLCDYYLDKTVCFL
jgi:hypothetical protein